MTKLFILIKRKGTKKWIGAIPTRKNLTKLQANKAAREQIKKKFDFKIITETELNKIFSKVTGKTKVKRKPIKPRRKQTRCKFVRRKR